MARYSCGMTTTIAGSATLPCFSIYSVAGSSPVIREFGFFNTTTTATGTYALRRLTTTGTQGAGQTEVKWDPTSPTAAATVFAGHTVGPTLTDNFGFQASLPGVIGAGVIWTFSGSGLMMPVGTANGIGLLCTAGTGQILNVYIVWDE